MRTLAAAVLLVSLVIIPVGVSAAERPVSGLKIDRIMLYFENRRAETTVERGAQRLKAFADLRYSGAGLLEANWEVDGRVLSRVSQHLRDERSITLTVPKVPGMPTMDPGTHIVRLVITTPSVDIPTPSILYFVLPKDAKKVRNEVRAISPHEDSKIAYGPVTFAWEQSPDVELYLISFFEKRGSKPLFSAYVKGATFELCEPVLSQVFVKGKRYYWKVTGYDVEKNAVSEHKEQMFSFAP